RPGARSVAPTVVGERARRAGVPARSARLVVGTGPAADSHAGRAAPRHGANALGVFAGTAHVALAGPPHAGAPRFAREMPPGTDRCRPRAAARISRISRLVHGRGAHPAPGCAPGTVGRLPDASRRRAIVAG